VDEDAEPSTDLLESLARRSEPSAQAPSQAAVQPESEDNSATQSLEALVKAPSTVHQPENPSPSEAAEQADDEMLSSLVQKKPTRPSA
jgi:hypothetical protein